MPLLICFNHRPQFIRRSAGKKIDFEGVEYTVEEVTDDRYY
jgi:hypothetical protein